MGNSPGTEWRGVPIERLSREELIEALDRVGRMLLEVTKLPRFDLAQKQHQQAEPR